MLRFAFLIGLAGTLALVACTPKEPAGTASDTDGVITAQKTDGSSTQTAANAVAPTLVGHRPTFEKILGNSGLALQWISWEAEERGTLEAMWDGSMLFLDGEQSLYKVEKAVQYEIGRIRVEGRVVTVSKDEFTFNGIIEIQGVPDAGRYCVKEGMSKFAITKGRKYFRLREFEWCDRLTDYVDIYF